MALSENKSTGIALNVTRTRVTVLAFNLTIISLMLSIKVQSGEITQQHIVPHLSSTVALFAGFCVTILGLWWLLVSQNQDAQGLSRPWPFTFGAITTYLALSQTTSAFMHEYLVGVVTAVQGAEKALAVSLPGILGEDSTGQLASLLLLVMGGATWFLMTYVAPLITVIRGPLAGRWSWVFALYYLAIQVPIFWVYAKAWQLASIAAQEETSALTLFAFQFFQPVLWFR